MAELTDNDYASMFSVYGQEEEKPGGSFKDYMVTTSGAGLPIYHPEAVPQSKFSGVSSSQWAASLFSPDSEEEYKRKANTTTYSPDFINFEEKGFQEMFDAQPIEVQRRMMEASSNENAHRIALASQIQADAMKNMQGDGLVMSLGKSIVPGILNPSSVIPIGGIGGTLLKTGAGAAKILKATAVGASTGAVANVLDETVLDKYGMEVHYTNALYFGAAFGGVLGFGGGVLDNLYSNPLTARRNAELVLDVDSVDNNFAQHPNTVLTDEAPIIRDEEIILQPSEVEGGEPTPIIRDRLTGAVRVPEPEVVLREPENVPRIDSEEPTPRSSYTDTGVEHNFLHNEGPAQKQEGFLNRATKFWSDDVHLGFASASQVGRNVMDMLAPAMVSLRDMSGRMYEQSWTVLDHKRRLQGYHGNLDVDIGTAYFNHSTSKAYKGNRTSYEAEVSDAYNSVSNKQEMDAYRHANIEVDKYKARHPEALVKEVDEVKKKALDDYYTTRDPLEGLPLHIKDGVKAYHKYYQGLAKDGAGAGMKKLDVHNNKYYKPRLLDYNTISKDLSDIELKQLLIESFKTHPANRLTDAEAVQVGLQYFDHIKDVKFKQDFTHSSYLMPEMSEVPGNARIMNRKYHLNEELLKDYLQTDMKDITSAYNHQMTGNIAMYKKFGTSNYHDLMATINRQLAEEGNIITQAELEGLHRVFEDLFGTLRMNPLSNTPAWQYSRIAMSSNAISMGKFFGVYQFTEAMANMVMNHMPSMLQSGFGRNLKTMGKMLYTKNGTPDTDTAQFLVNLGYLKDGLTSHHINRAADTEIGFDAGWVEKGLHKVGDLYYKLNALRAVKIFQEASVGGALMREIPKIAGDITKGKLSKADLARITRWGLNEEGITTIARDLDAHYDYKTGKFDLDLFSQEGKDLFQLATIRNMEGSVLQGDSIYVPSKGVFNYKDSNMVQKLALQFTRFPAMAHNILTRRGFTEDQARVVGGAMSAWLGYVSVMYMIEQAEVALGIRKERDTKFDIFAAGSKGAEAQLHALTKGMSYTAMLGLFTSGYSWGAKVAGYPDLGTDYVTKDGVKAISGPTFSRVDDLIDVGRHLIGSGSMTDEQAVLKAKSVTIGNLLPIFDTAITHTIKENY